MQTIERATWPRRRAFVLFRDYADPYFDLSVRVAAPGVLEAAAERGHPPFVVTMHALTASANEVPELRTRIRGDEVVRFDEVHPSWVIQGSDGTMRFANGRFDPDLSAFVQAVDATERAARAKPPVTDAHAWDDFLYLTYYPRLDLQGVCVERSARPTESVPQLTWGRLVDGSFGLTVSAHRGLVDGWHVQQLVGEVEDRLAGYSAI